MALFDKLGTTLMNAGKDVSQKARDLSDTAKLSIDIHSKEDQVEKLYAEIGMRYYMEHKDDEPAAYEQMTQITEMLTVIDDMKKELLELKGAKVCARCGSEIDVADAYCKNCGAKIEEEDIVVDAVVREAEDEAADEQEAPCEECAEQEITEEAFED